MNLPLAGKVIVITGAATGIGRASARIFAEAGARLVLADLNVADGESIAQNLKESGFEVVFIKTDVSLEADVEAMVNLAVSTFGRLDGAFNNAGIGYANKRIHEVSLAEWSKTIAVNLTGVYLCMKHEIAAMLPNGGGCIVNTGSVASEVALPAAPEYNAAKHGVLGITRNAALDYGTDGIRINAVLPGATKTPLVDRQRETRPAGQAGGEDKSVLKRMAEPSEIGEAAAWLLSDKSSYVTGQAINVDGGFTIS